MGKGKNYALSVAFIMLFAGIFIMALPYIRQWNFDRKADTLIDDYREWMEEQRDEAMESTGTDTKEKVLYLADLYEAMQEYNREIYENKQEDFRDAWSYQSPSFELSDWGLKENMIGYINIPRMKVNLPIYLGATTENMKKGAVNLVADKPASGWGEYELRDSRPQRIFRGSHVPRDREAADRGRGHSYKSVGDIIL